MHAAGPSAWQGAANRHGIAREIVTLEGIWRLRPESNRRTRICNPLRNHSATEPIQMARD